MVEAVATPASTLEEARPHQRSALSQTWRAYRRDRAAVVSLAIIVLFALLALAAPLLPLDDPIDGDRRLSLQGPLSEGHLLGVDKQGRDILSRVIWGGRSSLPIAITPVILATLAGMVLGVTAGYLGGPGARRWGRLYDGVVMRLNDVIFAFPTVVLAITIAAYLGNGPRSVVIASAVVLVPPISRVAYAATREQLGRDFVLAARALGASNIRVMIRHIVPNMLAPVVVYVTTLVGLMVVFTAGLSFLGLGIQPPNAEWGIMVSQGREVLNVAPHVAAVPGTVIAIVALAFNLAGDGLRYALDPRVRNL